MSIVRVIALILLGAAVLAAGSVAAQSPDITFSSLLKEMTDLNRLSVPPEPAYQAGQFSSYDRKATDIAVQSDENWYANHDRGNHLRVEGRDGEKEWVMMDVEGPGAVVRFWSANPDEAGVLRVYLDGAAEPALELPLSEFLGGVAPWTPKPIGGQRGAGWNSYLPIPYATRCKITASKPDFYYIINYRSYAPGTSVETLRTPLRAAEKELLEQTAERLSKPEAIALPAGLDDTAIRVDLAPGAVDRVPLPPGPRVVSELQVRIDAEDVEAAYRGCLLEVFYDDANRPAIQAPLGDFFGTAPGPQPFQSLPCGLLKNGTDTLYARWPMPYRDGMELRLTNTGSAPMRVNGVARTQIASVGTNRYYLHAKWRAARDLPTRPRRDWNFATIEGAGRFVGTMLHVSNPVKVWWGEGDEKIYVDGETFPSFFGTGSEDYFGYAWCSNQVFTHAYHNQPRCDGPGNFGHTCVSRFHIMDDIPFNESFQFDMEVWHWKEVQISQSAITWWYAPSGGSDNFERPNNAALSIPDLPPPPQPKRVEGALEGESMPVSEITGGKVRPQESEIWPWSGAKQIWWVEGSPGDRLDLTFSVPEDGTYAVMAVFTRAPDYAIVEVSLDGAPVKTALDLFGEGVAPTEEMSLGTHDLAAGDHTISVTISGRNPEAIPAYMFGLDYIRLEPTS